MQKVQIGDIYGQLTIIQLSAETKGHHVYHLCQCSCGKQCLKRTDQLRNMTNPSCGCLSPVKKKDKIGDKNGLLTIIKAYIKTDGKHSWHLCQCECGKECEIRTDNFRTRKSLSCGCAYVNKLQDKVGDANGLLTIIIPYVQNDGRHSWHKCRCTCGNICEVRADHFRTNQDVSCGCSYTNAKKIKIGDKYGLLTVIEAYIRSDGIESWHKCKCECGNTCEIRGKSLRTGKTTSCGCINSKGEMNIRKILDNNAIKYKQQYVFPDLVNKNKNHLFFDFAVFNDKNEILFLIEYNGEQHYQPVDFFGGEEKFKTQQSHDNLKIEYCNLHSIPLLIIPYWDFNNLENLVLNKFKEVSLNANL